MAETSSSAVFSGLSVLQLLAARKLKNAGARGSAAGIATRALTIATLYVGAGACGFLGLLGAFGLSTIEDYKKVGEDIRKAARRKRLEDPNKVISITYEQS